MKLFLSRDEASEALTSYVHESGHQLTVFSCIQKKIITNNPPPEADWIFFYSPSAVELFVKNSFSTQSNLAVLGKGTASAFRGHGIEPEFVGVSPDTSEAMVEFMNVLSKDETVVQARGETSFERLREVLEDEQMIDWPFYETTSKESFSEVDADAYIFTSPSNARAYLEKFNLSAESVVITFGQSTKKAVEKYTTAKVLITDEPGEKSAIKVLKKISSDL